MNRYEAPNSQPVYKFTPDAKRLLEYSHMRAYSLQKNEVGSDDLLYAVFQYPSAEVALANLGISREQLDQHFDFIATMQRTDTSKASKVFHFTPRARKTLDWARAEARGRTDQRILPLDIALCVVRETDGFSAAVFDQVGVNREDLLSELTKQREHDLLIEKANRRAIGRRYRLTHSFLPPAVVHR